MSATRQRFDAAFGSSRSLQKEVIRKSRIQKPGDRIQNKRLQPLLLLFFSSGF
jgi:hypothetical protein